MYEVAFLVVHAGSCRQTIRILSMSQECLRTGDKALVRCRFIKMPEYLRPGQRMVLREGRTKAVGNIKQVFHDAPSGSFDPHAQNQQRSGQVAGNNVLRPANNHNNTGNAAKGTLG